MICSETIAKKIALLKDAGEWLDRCDAFPKLNEIMWFLQARSTQPAGLKGFVDELIRDYPGHFVSDQMHKLGNPGDAGYNLNQCLEVWEGFRSRHNRCNRFRNYENGCDDATHENFGDWLCSNVSPRGLREGKQDLNGLERGRKIFNYNYLSQKCQMGARQCLEAYLRDVCIDFQAQLGAPWFCHNLPGLLVEYIERHADRQFATIAQTEVSKLVFRSLNFACSQTVPVPLVGPSRIGKSSPASVWCAARPGRARLVTVPESNRFKDFIEAHAVAFGISFLPSTPVTTLVAQVKFVQFHSGLFVVYDESHFLVPVRYHKTTPPARLDFVRCQVIDRNLGCAFVATPQSYNQTLDQYVKTTGYHVGQWLGRLAPAVILPADLSLEDVVSVAQKHFPQVDIRYLKLIAGRAMASEGYLKAVEMTAKRALFIAEENGRKLPVLDDVKLAIDEMMPVPMQPGRAPVAAAPQPIRKEAAARVARHVGNDFPSRSLNPSCPENTSGVELNVG